MALGDFVIVTPPGWSALQAIAQMVHTMGAEGVRDLVHQGAWGELNERVEEAGERPEGMTLAEARFIETGSQADPYYLWMRFEPLP
jgi:hypothetical protein